MIIRKPDQHPNSIEQKTVTTTPQIEELNKPIVLRPPKIQKRKEKKARIFPDSKVPSIEICNFIYRYPRRCWWQLSSIAGQIATSTYGVPKIKYTLNLHKGDPGNDLNLKMIETFSPLIDLNVRWWDTDNFYRRGATRGEDIRQASEDYILFVDGDQVFHPEFFATLGPLMKKWDTQNEGRCISHWRYTMPIEDGNRLVDSEKYINEPIKDWEKKIATARNQKRFGARGAGGFQLVNTRLLKERNITSYGRESGDSDVSQRIWYNTKSEQHFRNGIGGVKNDECDSLKPFWHLNHFRFDERLEALDSDYLF